MKGGMLAGKAVSSAGWRGCWVGGTKLPCGGVDLRTGCSYSCVCALLVRWRINCISMAGRSCKHLHGRVKIRYLWAKLWGDATEGS